MLLIRIARSAGFLAGGCTLLLAAAVWAACQTPASPMTPSQVADTLDGIIQPRFLANAGRFGMDRVVVGGHDDVYELDAKSRADRSRLRRVKQARRPFIIAFLHCTHKPGRDVGSKKPEDIGEGFAPSVSVLAAGTKTQAGTGHLYDWGEAHLNSITIPYLPRLRQGRSAELETGNWVVAMRPVRASRDSCLGCHAGAKRGDTLGVMVYAVDENVNRDSIESLQAGFR